MSSTLPSVRFEWPHLRLPIFFIVDDPAPCLNLAFYEQYWEPHVRDVPNAFTSAWADVVEEFGIRGKFSVLPIPAGIGRIDRPLPGVEPAAQEEFLRIIRERVSPHLDICIEFLTHFLAWDLRGERPADYTEKMMGPFTNRGHLTEYFSYGLRILADLGLNPTGATSPGPSCRDVEGAYQAAIRDAVREVTGSPIAWYFLHVDVNSPVVPPRVMSLDRETGGACVSMVSAGNDASWRTQFGEPSRLDSLITADGQRGRLVDLYRNGSAIGFHTHWQSLFSEGRWTGLHDLRVTLGRIREHFGAGVQWMKCSELARYTAAQAAATTEARLTETGWEIRLRSPFACPAFTVSVPLEEDSVRRVRANGRDLHCAEEGFPDNAWGRVGGGIAWCCALPAGELLIEIDHEA